MRACTKCGEVKPLEAFPPVWRGEDKRQTWCRDCFASYGKAYYRRNHEREKTRLLKNLAARRTENHQKIVAYLQSHPCVDCGETDIVVLEFDHLAQKLADISKFANGSRSWERIAAEIAKCEVRCANCHRRKTLAHARVRATTTNRRGRRGRAIDAVQLDVDGLIGVRTCRVCGFAKSLSEFPYRSVERRTRQHICLECQRVYARTWYQRNRASHIANSREHRKAAAAALKERVHSYLLTHPCVDCGVSDPDILDFDHRRDKVANVSALVHFGMSWSAVSEEIAKCDVRCANCHRRRTAAAASYYRTNPALNTTI